MHVFMPFDTNELYEQNPNLIKEAIELLNELLESFKYTVKCNKHFISVYVLYPVIPAVS